jgi:dihydrofolate reductase
MIVSIIVAASTNNAIGKNNQLPWHLPNDMKFFKNTTWGMPVIMGRKTFESFAGGPLPGRFNFVISRQEQWPAGQDKIKRASSIQEAIALARQTDCKEVFIIGGAQIYSESIQLAERIYLTRVHAVIEGDAFFPEISPDQWEMVSHSDFPADEKHAYSYSFQLWARKNGK